MVSHASAYEARLRRVIDYIYDHADEDLSLDRLADVAAMSRFHWHRVFRAMTGETCAQAVRRIRLRRAGFMLITTAQSIDEIARACGLGGRSAFTRAFTEAYGISPAKFRDHGTASPQLRSHSNQESNMYDVTIETSPGYRAMALSHSGAYQEIARSFEKLGTVIAGRDLWSQVQAMAGIYYDDPSTVPEEKLRSHAAAIIAADMAIPEGLEEVTIPAGRMAKLQLVGPYTQLPSAYDFLYGAWLQSSGEEPSNTPSFEVYRNSPLDTAPEALITDIYMPLK